MDFSDTVAVLRETDLFSQLDPSKLKFVAFASDYLTLDDGEELFRAGDPGDSVYLIEEGEAEIISVQPDGGEALLGTLGRQQLIGEMAIFRNDVRVATIRAKGDLKVIKIDGDMFLKLVTENPNSALGVMRALSEKLALATKDVQDLNQTILKLREGES